MGDTQISIDERRLAFSKRSVLAVEPPESGRLYVYDTKMPHLALCVTSAGARTFYRVGRIAGRPDRIRLGTTDELTVEKARKLVAKLNVDVAGGKDPARDRQQRRTGATLGELFAWYLEHHSKLHKRTWKRDERRYERYLVKWKNRLLSAVTKSDVQALHTRTAKERGQYAANHVLELIRHMFATSAAMLGYDGPNPAHGIQKFEKIARERFMAADELPRFFTALNTLRPTSRDFFLTALYTGARRSNVLQMRWDELTLETGTWLIPASKSKSKKPMTIHLSPEAMEVIRSRLADRVEGCPWVFPGQGPSGHYSEPKDAWSRVLDRAGLKNLRIHDLRRTLGSWQAAGGASLIVIGKSLGHSTPAATAVYARLNLDPVRQSVNSATAAIALAGKAEVSE